MEPTGRRALVSVLAAGLVSATAAACGGMAAGVTGGSPAPSATTSASGTPVGPSRTPVPPTSIRPTIPPVSPTVRPTVQPTVQPTLVHPTVQPPVPTEPGQPRKPPTGGVDMVLTGMAVMGAEPGCVGLRANGRTYELAGDAPQRLAGDRGYGQELGRVRVSGHLAPKMMASHCMMGPIFVVQDLTRL